MAAHGFSIGNTVGTVGSTTNSGSTPYDPSNPVIIPGGQRYDSSGMQYINSSDQVVQVGGYIKFIGSILDPYIYTAQEADQVALDKLRAQAEIEKARAQAAGIQPAPITGAVPGWAWALVGGGGAITLLLLMAKPKKEK